MADLKENIEELYGQIDDKDGLIKLLASEFKQEEISVRNNWFGKLMYVPKKHRARTIELMQNTIALKNQSA